MHISVPMYDHPCEFINVTPLNPLISKCQIKVCYVGDEPNRNGSVITKEVARQMANSLPGSPIVGFYNRDSKDFEEHNRELEIKDGELLFNDTTRPYGFVDLGAKVWFQTFLDDGANEREYLCTEGFLWTGQYPEVQRVIDQGNNQSMELDEKHMNASWSKSPNGEQEFFIINEAIISKLCILGEDFEPCFEGASVNKVQFSFDKGFKTQLFSLMKEMKEILDEGGSETMENENIINEEVITEEVNTEFKEDEKKCPKCGKPLDECTCDKEDEDKKFAEEKKDDEDKKEKICPKCGKPLDECTCDKDEKKEEDKKEKYNLDEIQEYQELNEKFSALTEDYNKATAEIESLKAEREELVAFKASVDKQKKEEMIDSFYMLSDEDKKEVRENIDNYSLDDIEAKLSIICVRNKVSFNLDDDIDDNEEKTDPTVYNLSGSNEVDSAPAWIKTLRSHSAN